MRHTDVTGTDTADAADFDVAFGSAVCTVGLAVSPQALDRLNEGRRNGSHLDRDGRSNRNAADNSIDTLKRNTHERANGGGEANVRGSYTVQGENGSATESRGRRYKNEDRRH